MRSTSLACISAKIHICPNPYNVLPTVLCSCRVLHVPEFFFLTFYISVQDSHSYDKKMFLPVTASLPSRGWAFFPPCQHWVLVLWFLSASSGINSEFGPFEGLGCGPWWVLQSVPSEACQPPTYCRWQCQVLWPISESCCSVTVGFSEFFMYFEQGFFIRYVFGVYFLSVCCFSFHSLGRVFAEQKFLRLLLTCSLTSLLAFVVAKKSSPDPRPCRCCPNNTF